MFRQICAYMASIYYYDHIHIPIVDAVPLPASSSSRSLSHFYDHDNVLSFIIYFFSKFAQISAQFKAIGAYRLAKPSRIVWSLIDNYAENSTNVVGMSHFFIHRFSLVSHVLKGSQKAIRNRGSDIQIIVVVFSLPLIRCGIGPVGAHSRMPNESFRIQNRTLINSAWRSDCSEYQMSVWLTEHSSALFFFPFWFFPFDRLFYSPKTDRNFSIYGMQGNVTVETNNSFFG